MAKDPAFLFYPGDWLGGTMTFTRSHKGAYMDLLMAQFNEGSLCMDDIKTILGNDFNSMWEQRLKAKFILDDSGRYYNEKLRIEIYKRRNFTDSRKNNLKKPEETTTHMDTHMDYHMENENEIYNNTPIIDNKDIDKGGMGEKEKDFEFIWNEYGRKDCDKKKALTKFLTLSKKDIEKIKAHVPTYVLSTPDKQFRKMFITYLNQKHWESEEVVFTQPSTFQYKKKGTSISDIQEMIQNNESNLLIQEASCQ